MPLLWVKSDKSVVWLHLDPSHLISDIHPPFLLEELDCAELGAIVGHIVEHVEKDGVGEGFDRGLGQTFRFAHDVARWDADVNLETVIVVGIAKLLRLPLLRGWNTHGWLAHGRLRVSWLRLYAT